MDCAVKTCKKASTFLFIVFIETAYACQRKLRLLCLTKIFDVDPTRNYLSFRSTIFISFYFSSANTTTAPPLLNFLNNVVNMEDFEPDTNLFAGNYNYQKLEITGSPILWLDEFGKVYILNKHNAATDTTYLKCRQHTRARGTVCLIFN